MPERWRSDCSQRSNAFVKYELVHSRRPRLMRLDQRRITNAMEIMDECTRKTGYILIVDNDPAIRQNVSEYFSTQHIPTISAPDWSELKGTDGPPSLIVMDRQTSRNDGLDWLRSIRSKSDVPVIMTGDVPDEMDRVIGLELGADDYVVKPFGLRDARTCPCHFAPKGDGGCRPNRRF